MSHKKKLAQALKARQLSQTQMKRKVSNTLNKPARVKVKVRTNPAVKKRLQTSNRCRVQFMDKTMKLTTYQKITAMKEAI